LRAQRAFFADVRLAFVFAVRHTILISSRLLSFFSSISSPHTIIPQDPRLA
jgi:hypothetical protein